MAANAPVQIIGLRPRPRTAGADAAVEAVIGAAPRLMLRSGRRDEGGRELIFRYAWVQPTFVLFSFSLSLSPDQRLGQISDRRDI